MVTERRRHPNPIRVGRRVPKWPRLYCTAGDDRQVLTDMLLQANKVFVPFLIPQALIFINVAPHMSQVVTNQSGGPSDAKAPTDDHFLADTVVPCFIGFLTEWNTLANQ